MNIHNIDIELPAEFRSGNSVPVTVATIKRERMEEILINSIEADRQRRGEQRIIGKIVLDGNRHPRAELATGYDEHGDQWKEGTPIYAAPQPAEPVKVPSDAEIEAYMCGLGMRWHDDVWKIEDADLHPTIRALLARYCNNAGAAIECANMSEIHDGDSTIVISVPQHLKGSQRQKLHEIAERAFPGRRLMIVDGGIEVFDVGCSVQMDRIEAKLDTLLEAINHDRRINGD